MGRISEWMRAAADVVFPRFCSVCGQVLDADETYLCRGCMMALPRTHLEEIEFNQMEQLFAGKVRIKRATGYFYYEKSSPYVQILHDIKYRNLPRMAQWLAARAVDDMRDSGFFDSVEVVVPVPLHVSKLAQRGYNQSDYIARGLAQRLHVPVCHALVAKRAHGSQTRRGATERWLNAQNTYFLNPSKAGRLENRSVLLVDDVVTTGATLEACVRALQQVPGVSVSVFTLAAARLD